MSSKTQNVGHFVEYRLKRIVNSSSDGAVKASLANLRRGIGTTPGDIPELWELFLQDLPEEMLSRSGVPTHAQWAVYIALTLFALHQQGKDLQKESMYRQENGLGKAVACLIHGEDDKTRIQRRFNVLATSADIQELAHHLRGMYSCSFRGNSFGLSRVGQRFILVSKRGLQVPGSIKMGTGFL